MSLLKKITVMAILGAVGAVVGAVAGESLFLNKPEPKRTEPRQLCLLFDISGSMNEIISRPNGEGSQTQIAALKAAACDFLARQDLELDSIGLAVFASGAHVVTGLSHDTGEIQKAILGLNANGGTNLGRGLDVASTMLRYDTGERWILLFSDGKPESSSTRETPEQAALSAAARAREAGIEIVAIGTPLADADLLSQATGSPQNVIISDPSALHDAFERSEEVINNRQMLASAGGSESFQRNVLQTGIWASLIAIGAGLGLVIAQNRHMRRGTLRPLEVVIVMIGGLIAGMVAGAAGQTIFYVLSDLPAVVGAGRVVAWVLLGYGVGYGMGFFVPNLHRSRAGAAAAAGGAVAAFCFLTLVPALGDVVGRLLGAGILGLSAGLMIVLVEATFRKACLIVHWSEKERSTLALGSTPIVVGSSSEAHVLLAEQDSPVPVMARITLKGDAVELHDGKTRSTRTLRDGEILTYGRIRIEVQTGGGDAAPSSSGSAREREERLSRERAKPAPKVPAPVRRAIGKEARWYSVVQR